MQGGRSAVNTSGDKHSYQPTYSMTLVGKHTYANTTPALQLIMVCMCACVQVCICVCVCACVCQCRNMQWCVIRGSRFQAKSQRWSEALPEGTERTQWLSSLRWPLPANGEHRPGNQSMLFFKQSARDEEVKSAFRDRGYMNNRPLCCGTVLL